MTTTGGVRKEYVRIAASRELDVLTGRRMTDLVEVLRARGLVSSRVISKGRQGRTKEIRLLSNPDQALGER